MREEVSEGGGRKKGSEEGGGRREEDKGTNNALKSRTARMFSAVVRNIS